MSTTATRTKRTVKPAKRELSYQEWKTQVDNVMHQMCGLGVDSIPESFGLKERFQAGADIGQTAVDAYEALEPADFDDEDAA